MRVIENSSLLAEEVVNKLKEDKILIVKDIINSAKKIDLLSIYKLNSFIVEKHSNSLIIIAYARVLKECSAELLQHFERTLMFQNKKYCHVSYEKHLHRGAKNPRFFKESYFSRFDKKDVANFLVMLNGNYAKNLLS